MKRRWADPAFKEKMIKHARARWADPERRAKQSERFKAVWADPEPRAKLSGENASNWRGGLSFEPYPPGWTRFFKKEIRERDNHICGLCDKKGSKDIHHIDYNKKNLDPMNLIILCKTCHSKTNGNREAWTAYFLLSRCFKYIF